MRKLLIAIALMLTSCTPAAAHVPADGPHPSADTPLTAYFLDIGTISKIDCDEHVGSGVRIDAGLIATAWHVASGTHCNIGGHPLVTVYHDDATDFAVMSTTELSATRAPISCAGIQAGQTYYGVGWALGHDWAVQLLTGTDGVAPRAAIRNFPAFAGTRMLRGSLFPGQSGGAIFDSHGDYVAFIDGSMRDGRQLALVRSLQDTYLCPHG